VSLRAGERRSVAFRLGPRELGFLDRDLRFVVEPGMFKVAVGQSSVGGLEALFEVTDH
jgi:beta-glucosidase